ncbi:Qat anti-phage system QueC-like protein QatC [Rubrobacter indicoceani]|uniref:Qat anti-phage system QueC-like protein QatC n=1 Tax=Rubrobacter indicoceani TaxID=2051957 RepID=UPI000E5BA952|nr:Qat anti-phage system QueC-like protein QatC [Rubrobacter indicoceani]
MSWHVVCLAGPEDRFAPALSPADEALVVPLDVPGHPYSLRTTVPDVLAEYGIVPSDAARDLLNAAVAAYTADVRIPRRSTFDGWTRDLTLHLPVRSARWSEGAGVLTNLLRFLTGDHWTVEVRRAPDSYSPLQGDVPRRGARELAAETVCLFSGGLDSYIGAVDLLESGGRAALVGHHSAGGGATSTSQKGALAALRAEYTEERTPLLQFWISPPKGEERASEITTRGRSILFLSLGVAVADGLQAERLLVPENGLISLNVPLTNSRLGSLSTRTTHPYTMKLFRELLTSIGVDVGVELPYRFRTKGEMLCGCVNDELVVPGLLATMSCSHPGASRFAGKSPNIHCGYCVPCVIRRAAVASSGLSDPTAYGTEDLSRPPEGDSGSDLRTLRIALDRYRKAPPTVADVLVPGPLPGTDEELAAYLDVFSRGLDEVRDLLIIG